MKRALTMCLTRAVLLKLKVSQFRNCHPRKIFIMKMRLDNTVIELDNIAYAQKYNDRVGHIYFVNREKK